MNFVSQPLPNYLSIRGRSLYIPERGDCCNKNYSSIRYSSLYRLGKGVNFVSQTLPNYSSIRYNSLIIPEGDDCFITNYSSTLYSSLYKQGRIEGRAAGHSPSPPGPLRGGGRRPPPSEQITIFLFLISIILFKISHYEDDGN